jgi:hypothetical protein
MINAERARRQQSCDIPNCSRVLDALEVGSAPGGCDDAIADIWQKNGSVND